MFDKPSLMTRVAVGKGIGFLIGLIAFMVLPIMSPETSTSVRWGVLFWYTTFGAIIGVFGVFTAHPILKIPLPWWIRAPFIGAWLNFVLALIAYDTLRTVMAAAFGAEGALQSPYWVVLEGALVGLLIGFFATRLGGEGVLTVQKDFDNAG